MMSPTASIVSTPSNGLRTSVHKKLFTPSSTKRSEADDLLNSTPNDGTMVNSFYEEGGSIRKLPLCGEKDSTKPGFSTFDWQSKTAKTSSTL